MKYRDNFDTITDKAEYFDNESFVCSRELVDDLVVEYNKKDS